MAVEEGVATGHVDLLNKLVTFLTTTMTPIGERWVLEKTATVNGEEERYLRGVGLSGTDNIYVNLRTVTVEAWKVYNWELQGATGFNTGNTFENQPGANPTDTAQSSRIAPTLVLNDQNIEYTFIANGRRVVILAKMGDIITSSYLGFLLPYASQADYPYPLVISGSSSFTKTNVDLLYPTSGVLNSVFDKQDMIKSFFNPIPSSNDGQAAFLYDHKDRWLILNGREGTASSVGPSAQTEVAVLWPWCIEEAALSSRVSLHPMINRDTNYTLIPGVACWALKSGTTTTINATQLSNMMTYGELDGVYFVPSLELGQYDTFTINLEDYVVVGEPFLRSFNLTAAIKKV